MVRISICLMFVLALLNGCSNQSEKPINAENYGYPEEQKAPPASKNDVTEIPLKNTSTYHTVVIRQMKFEPAELRLHKGDTVLWINKDITDHDITEEGNKKWSSSKLPMNQSWSMVVNQNANYYCSIHVVMKGKLIVE